jgi:hypothetical protein
MVQLDARRHEEERKKLEGSQKEKIVGRQKELESFTP